MSWPSAKRLCRNCGGVSISPLDYVTGKQLKQLDYCQHCNAPLTGEDEYNGISLPAAHTKEKPVG